MSWTIVYSKNLKKIIKELIKSIRLLGDSWLLCCCLPGMIIKQLGWIKNLPAWLGFMNKYVIVTASILDLPMLFLIRPYPHDATWQFQNIAEIIIIRCAFPNGLFWCAGSLLCLRGWNISSFLYSLLPELNFNATTRHLGNMFSLGRRKMFMH